MLKRSIRTLTVLAAAAGVAAAATAAPAAALAVGPNQYFTGSVTSPTDYPVIQVFCESFTSIGHPLPNQAVAVHPLLPPATISAGYTGLSATSIDAWLSWPSAIVAPQPVPIAKFTTYGTAPIPTNVTVPCSGAGVLSFVPNPDNGGRPSKLNVAFQSVNG